MKTLGFSKREKLKSRNMIDALYAGGKSFAVFPIRLKYQLLPADGMTPVQAGVSVSKRAFKRAVDRNRIKRLLREAYRLQKASLLQAVEAQKLRTVVFFMFTGKRLVSFEVIAAAMTTCLQQLQQNVLSYENAD